MSLGDEVRSVARLLIDAYQDVVIDYGAAAAAARSLADTSRRVEEMNDRADTTTDAHTHSVQGRRRHPRCAGRHRTA